MRSPTSSDDLLKGPPKLPRLAIPLLPEANNTLFNSCFCRRTCRSRKSIFWQMSRTQRQPQESVLAVVVPHTESCLCAQPGLLGTSPSYRSGLRYGTEKYCRKLRGDRESQEREKQFLARESAARVAARARCSSLFLGGADVVLYVWLCRMWEICMNLLECGSCVEVRLLWAALLSSTEALRVHRQWFLCNRWKLL